MTKLLDHFYVFHLRPQTQTADKLEAKSVIFGRITLGAPTPGKEKKESTMTSLIAHE